MLSASPTPDAPGSGSCSVWAQSNSNSSFAYGRRGNSCEGYYLLPVSDTLRFEPISFTDGSEDGVSLNNQDSLFIDWARGLAPQVLHISPKLNSPKLRKDTDRGLTPPLEWKPHVAWRKMKPDELAFLIKTKQKVGNREEIVLLPAKVTVHSPGQQVPVFNQYRLLVRATGSIGSCIAQLSSFDIKNNRVEEIGKIPFCNPLQTSGSILTIKIDTSKLKKTGFYQLILTAPSGTAPYLLPSTLYFYHDTGK